MKADFEKGGLLHSNGIKKLGKHNPNLKSFLGKGEGRKIFLNPDGSVDFVLRNPKTGQEAAVTFRRTTGDGPEAGKFHPDFSPHATAKVEIEMNGNHSFSAGGDMFEANIKAGFPGGKRHNDYTWHHSEDRKTMLLVPRWLHNTSDNGLAHRGGQAT